jgi:putative membrane-bound dehydrogenase-like protein
MICGVRRRSRRSLGIGVRRQDSSSPGDGRWNRKGFDRIMPDWQRTRRSLAAAWLVLVSAAPLAAGEGAGLIHPDGFEVTLYADDDLAHDIYALTVDAKGRVVISGAGYVKILVDRDSDGVADTAREFATPASGAQGMYFFGNDLLCLADEGLLRYRDRNGDDRADGPADVFIRLKAGGEHDAHAIHRGPDGWWYLITGNNAEIGPQYLTTTTSPVTQPRAGAVLRFSPDLTQGEVFAHGFRNAYDFAFDAQGDLLTADSDGERDVSLPWYRPARVFRAIAGGDAGWLSESWKRPDGAIDMLPVTASLERSSPTGVVCYRHTQFPDSYQGALFVADWTYGRVFVLPPQNADTVTTPAPTEFLKASGALGFAPTGMAVGPDGSLYVSVGGRGTRGGVYRVRATNRPAENLLTAPAPLLPPQKLDLCLTCPEPLSSWSRRVWEPLVSELGSEPFILAAADETRATYERVRAIEILTEKFHGLDADLAGQLAQSRDRALRARAAWSLGRTQPGQPRLEQLRLLLVDDEPRVVEAALQSLQGATRDTLAALVAELGQSLGSPDATVRQLAARAVGRTDEETFHRIAAVAAPLGWRAGAALAAAYAYRHPGVDPYAIDIGLRILKAKHPVALQREAARLLQLGLGDVGPVANGSKDDRPPVFDGYAPLVDLSNRATLTDPIVATLSDVFPTGDAELDHELVRIAAMLQTQDVALADAIPGQITATSDPVEDLHRLIALARLPAARTEQQRLRICEGLLALEPKVLARGYIQDNHWEDRFLETFVALVTLDEQLPAALLAHPSFGVGGHARFLQQFPDDLYPQALEAFTARLLREPEAFDWNSDLVYLFAASPDPRVQELMRAQFDDFGLRSAVLLALSEDPQESDRELFVAGLESAQVEVLAACVKALSLLKRGQTAAENVALLRVVRRLEPIGDERMIRDQAVEALGRNTGHSVNYTLGLEEAPQEEAVAQWTRYIAETFPEEYALQTGVDQQELALLERMLEEVHWEHGDAARGALLFQKRACIQCHGSSRALGPDLAGVTGRFSREDLFTAIAVPSRDVSPRYQATAVVTDEGQSYTGLIVYESIDGLVLRDGSNRTFRIEAANIETRRKLSTSLMPSGLLKDLTPTDLADLFAYLHSLSSPTGSVTAQSPDTESPN